jgi:hypothetical protein
MIIFPKDLYTPFQKKYPQNFSISDSSYFCPTQSMIEKEIFPHYWEWLSALKWSKWMHKWDCDNFADAFKLFACGYYEQVIESNANGIAIGVVYYVADARAESGISGAHAINIIYAQDEQKNTNHYNVLFLEPQNGTFYKLAPHEFDSIFTVYI